MTTLNKMYPVPVGVRLQLHHLHSGNSSRKARHGHEYVTIANLVHGESVVVTATASCSHRDTPNRGRGRGRDIAVGRVIKAYYKRQAHISRVV